MAMWSGTYVDVRAVLILLLNTLPVPCLKKRHMVDIYLFNTIWNTVDINNGALSKFIIGLKLRKLEHFVNSSIDCIQ